MQARGERRGTHKSIMLVGSSCEADTCIAATSVSADRVSERLRTGRVPMNTAHQLLKMLHQRTVPSISVYLGDEKHEQSKADLLGRQDPRTTS